jgi:hypothetical protein
MVAHPFLGDWRQITANGLVDVVTVANGSRMKSAN